MPTDLRPGATWRARIAVFAVALTVAAAPDRPPAAQAAPSRPGGKLVPATGAYLGAFTSPGRWPGLGAYADHVTAREERAGRPFAVAHHFYGWTDPIPSGLEQWDITSGRIPMVTWQPSVGLRAINDGSQDELITRRARALAAFGYPVFLRWGHEMNGNWYPWDGTHNHDDGTTNGPDNYRKAWRRVHDIFTRQGAGNVVWVWQPGARSIPDEPWNHWDRYYPGDEYVDWVGIDGYNWGSLRQPGWTTFEAKFAPVYDSYADRKPVMVSETASTEQGGDKAGWIREAHAAIKARFPALAAVLWFDQAKETDWRFDSSPGALAAFRDLAADPYFAADAADAGSGSPAEPLLGVASAVIGGVGGASGPDPGDEPIAVHVARSPGGPRVPLRGAVVTGPAYVTATFAEPVTEVRFHLDDWDRRKPPLAVERHQPYELRGGQPLDTDALPPGLHHVTVVAELAGGGTATATHSFTR